MCEWTAMGSKKPEKFWVGTKNPLFSFILLCVPNISWPPFNLIWKNFILYWDFGRIFCMYQLFFLVSLGLYNNYSNSTSPPFHPSLLSTYCFFWELCPPQISWQIIFSPDLTNLFVPFLLWHTVWFGPWFVSISFWWYGI